MASEAIVGQSLGPEEGQRGFPRPLAALLLYGLLATALTWPLALHLGDRLPEGDNDLWQNYWNFWWWEESLVERHALPYSTDLLYQPGEVSLAFHTHSEANILLTFPVLLAAGVPAALNLATLLGFVFSGWGGYLLARELTRSHAAAFLGGIVLAFLPHHFEQSLEHLNLASYQAMPFFLLFLVRLVRTGGRSNTVLTALFFALNCLYGWHNGILVLPLAAILFASESLLSPRRAILVIRDAALAGLLAGLLVLPFAWPMVREILAGETYFLKPPVQKGVDPLFLIVPAENHPLWGSWFAGLYARSHSYASLGFTAYLGIVPLALAALGAVLRWRRPRVIGEGHEGLRWILWAAMFLGFVLLALGDPLTVLGKETGVRLPFALVRDLPLFKTIRIAHRFLVPAMICFSVIAALGAHALLAGRRPRPLFAGLTFLLVLDLLWIPYPMREIPSPRWVEAIESCPSGLLLDIPGGYRGRNSQEMFLQTLHGRALVGGYTSCLPPYMQERVKELPFLQLVFEGRPKVDVGVEAGLRETLEKLPIGVVVLHLSLERERLEELRAAQSRSLDARLYNPEKGIPGATLRAIRESLERLWGPPRYSDESVLIFARPPS